MHGVKDQTTLVQAFILLCERVPDAPVKLMIAGDGPLREPALQLLAEKNLSDRAWLAGDRSDIAQFMRYFDIFVLPSIAEGIPNTILEAMATGLPIIATDVGGNPELVSNEINGTLIPASNPEVMAETLLDYVNDSEKRQRHGEQSRQRALSEFSLATMVSRYQGVYDQLLGHRT
jgi:glycosyltransferase involved in cell wall biosynthesis